VLVWVVNINRFNDPVLGGWLQGAQHTAGSCRRSCDSMLAQMEAAKRRSLRMGLQW